MAPDDVKLMAQLMLQPGAKPLEKEAWQAQMQDWKGKCRFPVETKEIQFRWPGTFANQVNQWDSEVIMDSIRRLMQRGRF